LGTPDRAAARDFAPLEFLRFMIFFSPAGNRSRFASTRLNPMASCGSAVEVDGGLPDFAAVLTKSGNDYNGQAGTFDSRGLQSAVFALVCVSLSLSLLAFVISTWHWRLVNDAAQIDYACFLMDHGMAPYKDLLEINMPGIYMINWTVMHVLGTGSMAWRIFDLSLLAVAGLAMTWIAQPYGKLSAFFAAVLFALFHGRDGAAQAGQRDLIIAVLLLLAYAFLFHAVRRAVCWPMFVCGVCLGAAASIKPPALPFAFLVLAAAAIPLRTERRRVVRALALGLLGILASAAAVLAFLVAHGSLGAFVRLMRDVLPYYATLGRMSLLDLLPRVMSPTLRTLFALALLIAFLRRNWTWESLMLLAGVAFGIASYLAQGKGFPYHRYPMLAFVFLWAAIQFGGTLRDRSLLNRDRRLPNMIRSAALSGLVLGAIFAPLYARLAAHSNWDEDFNTALAADLHRLGDTGLSGHVQCLTTPGDCDTVLYRLGLVQSSGLIYDYLVFGPESLPAIEKARQTTWQALLENSPRVLIVGCGLYGETLDGYEKLKKWPQFASYLAANYTLYDERRFSAAESGHRGYRIYLRNDAASQTAADRQEREIARWDN
jgi:hypothetical protein